ncbi:Beta-lactamase/transpeptidase-like protein [Niveomyces insectorum RCEF 264]|uniref:Beta-lactamase/transpeptidase-like protein n=1 Tax=Niveomyces insectorum RCEF 264 TaxID=1081102 RepID=A0A167XSC0_9HYPO|nr:Beta-lactamase/transpeptidase-like protein [Niveomyces insectorum RCEF 264]
MLSHTLSIGGAVAFLAAYAEASLANTPCALIDADLPAPSQLATTGSSYVRAAADATQSLFLSAINGSATPYGQFAVNTTAFSVQVYSVHADDPLFTYHHTPPGLTAAHTVGVEAVDSETVYRLGSVSKLWTTYIYLIAAGDRSWNHPITDHVPELAALASAEGDVAGSVDHVDWSSITVGALASHLGGIARDAAYSPALQEVLGAFGVPNAGGLNHSTCGNADLMLPCNRSAFFEDFVQQRPIFASWRSPAYSNAAFQILAYALESITGRSMPDLFQTYLVQPLNLTGTYYTVPPENVTANGAIPFNATISFWNADALDETPAGGYYSTIDDMRKVGTAMLQSTQLAPAQTRRWMKPNAFLTDARAAVGAPWEIQRAPDGPGAPARWMYTKAGDLGLYSSTVILLPELGVGVSVLSAGTDTTNAVRILSDAVATSWVPALRAAAAAEAATAYAGTYTDARSNSTLVVAVNDSNPGLSVRSWTYGGVDVLALLGEVEGIDETTQQIVVNLYPSGLSQPKPGNCSVTQTQVGWRATFQALPQTVDAGPFSANCIAWEVVSQLVYGGVALDEFLFTVNNESGAAVAVEPRVLAQSQAHAGQTKAKSMKRRETV